MRTGIFILLVSLTISGAAQNPNKVINLFNGEDLSGWEYFLVDPDVIMDAVWSVNDGLLVCKGEPMGYLSTAQEYTNFKLVVEWRWAPGKEPGNSGVLMRISGAPQALPRCFEAQLQHGNAGAIFGFHGLTLSTDPERFIEKDSELTGKLQGATKLSDQEKKPGEWNVYEIYLLKGNLTLYINGVKVNEANGLAVHPGKIGFQSEGGEVHFRTIRLLPLDEL